MHLHEKRCIKRAGVAGIALRAHVQTLLQNDVTLSSIMIYLLYCNTEKSQMNSGNIFGAQGPSQGLSVLSPYGSPTSIVLPEVRGLWYHDKDIYLDGWKYVSCRFDNCRFYLNIGNFVLEECFIDDKCVVLYQGASLKVIQLYNRDSEFIRNNYPFFSAVKNPNGTYSLGV
jgi:hypothetical protein